MATVLIVPVFTRSDGWAVTQAVAAAMPDAVASRALDETGEAEKMLCAGKCDDWLDMLVARVGSLNAENIVIKGIKPDAEKIFLATRNIELALSLDANVVFSVFTDDGNAEHLTQKLNIAKQSYATAPGVLAGFVLDGGDAGLGAAVAEKTGLAYLGSTDNICNTDLLLKKTGRMSPAQFRVNMMESARKANKRIVLPEGAEPRTVQAAAICHEKGIARFVLWHRAPKWKP